MIFLKVPPPPDHTAYHQPHPPMSPAGSQPFRCLYCSATFRFPGALQHHVTTEHFKQSENTFPCELCGELFISQAQLHSHLDSEHPRATSMETPAATSQMVQVMLEPWEEGGGDAEYPLERCCHTACLSLWGTHWFHEPILIRGLMGAPLPWALTNENIKL